MNNIETGKIGEDIAYKYLVNKGYIIISRNYKERFDEIDIISRDPSGILIFCEVKTTNQKSNGFLGGFMPEDNLSNAKYRKMTRAANLFLVRYSELAWEHAGWQLDLIAIVLCEEGPITLRHYKNI